EHLLAEIVLAVVDQRDQALRRRLEKGLRQNSREREGEEIDARAVAQVRLQASAEDADEEQGKEERRDQARAVAQELHQVALRDRGRGIALLQQDRSVHSRSTMER